MALAEPARRRILDELLDGERSAGELVHRLGISQPSVSKHLRVLREAGIVDSERQGLWAYYYVKPEALKELTTWLS